MLRLFLLEGLKIDQFPFFQYQTTIVFGFTEKKESKEIQVSWVSNDFKNENFTRYWENMKILIRINYVKVTVLSGKACERGHGLRLVFLSEIMKVWFSGYLKCPRKNVFFSIRIQIASFAGISGWISSLPVKLDRSKVQSRGIEDFEVEDHVKVDDRPESGRSWAKLDMTRRVGFFIQFNENKYFLK